MLVIVSAMASYMFSLPVEPKPEGDCEESYFLAYSYNQSKWVCAKCPIIRLNDYESTCKITDVKELK